MFSFKKSKNIEFTQTARETFLVILTELIQILSKADLSTQAQVVQTLVNLLNQRRYEQFVKLLNGIDMWGGSGAVWEVHIENSSNAREFETEMIKLIDFMEEIKVLGKGIKPIRKTFKENVKGKE